MATWWILQMSQLYTVANRNDMVENKSWKYCHLGLLQSRNCSLSAPSLFDVHEEILVLY